MNARTNHRYRQAASDYLGLPRDHPEVITLAWRACQEADLAAFAVLREGARRVGRSNQDHALSRRLARL